MTRWKLRVRTIRPVFGNHLLFVGEIGAEIDQLLRLQDVLVRAVKRGTSRPTQPPRPDTPFTHLIRKGPVVLEALLGRESCSARRQRADSTVVARDRHALAILALSPPIPRKMMEESSGYDFGSES